MAGLNVGSGTFSGGGDTSGGSVARRQALPDSLPSAAEPIVERTGRE